MGTAATTMASTVAAGAFVGSATAYGLAVVDAAATSKTVEEFKDKGDWGTVSDTFISASVGGAWGAVSYAYENSVKVEKVGRIKPNGKKGNGYYGVKYQIKKPNGKLTTRSFELHSPHKYGPHQMWHWQRNTWNPQTNSISSKSSLRWTLFGRRF